MKRSEEKGVSKEAMETILAKYLGYNDDHYRSATQNILLSKLAARPLESKGLGKSRRIGASYVEAL
ncbi:hypothetical protein [Treponema vincentii]|uniref:hypothetical protein n=1 Tax=Treponema vincentii TaxID=69710 RepID=UPI0020A3456A|nr:hypothetical protein [Treponema vincentii]